MSNKPRSRVMFVALLLAASLGALLVAWFVSGWADVRARQRELSATRDAQELADRVARELHVELGQMIARESSRPYYHYGNLFHDPKAGGSGVTPSPLAAGPADPLVRGHFQIDAAGRVTTPTINDDVPELSERDNLADNTRFRDEVRGTLAKRLTETGTVVAQVTEKPAQPKPRPQQQQQQQQPQILQIDPQTYAANSNVTGNYWAQQSFQAPRPSQPRPPPLPSTVPTTPEGTIPITISAFDWHTEPFENAPALVAVRTVDTPDGRLTQGLVLDRRKLADWLDTRSTRGTLTLHPTSPDDAGDGHRPEPEVVAGWSLAAVPSAEAIEQAELSASSIATSFLIRFVVLGVIVALVFVLVIAIVARAEKLARERSQFAAAAAHELRTPLAGLQLYGDMLADGLGDPAKLSDYARRMSEEASRLGRVVSNVLGFSQLERGNLHINPQRASLGKVLCELAERAQPALDRAGAVLDLDVPPDLEATFDQDAVARIVGNLLDNAEKYSREAEDRTIGLVARAAKHEGRDAVEVVVTDHGPGVPDKARAKLFTAFARGVSNDGPAGLGLGLALSRSLADAMGGELDYRATGAGASFVLRLRA